MRLGSGAQVHSLKVSGLTIDSFETGVMVDEGVRGEGLRFEGITMREVITPWVIADADEVRGDVTLTSN